MIMTSAVGVQQDRHVRERIAIDQQQIGQVALFDLAQFVRLAMVMCSPPLRVAQRRRLGRRIAVVVDEELRSRALVPCLLQAKP